MKFSHPLARNARFWVEESIDNGPHDVLVVTTTLELEPGHKKFKRDKIDRLREAAKAYLKENHPKIRRVLIMNPPKA